MTVRRRPGRGRRCHRGPIVHRGTRDHHASRDLADGRSRRSHPLSRLRRARRRADDRRRPRSRRFRLELAGGRAAAHVTLPDGGDRPRRSRPHGGRWAPDDGPGQPTAARPVHPGGHRGAGGADGQLDGRPHHPARIGGLPRAGLGRGARRPGAASTAAVEGRPDGRDAVRDRRDARARRSRLRTPPPASVRRPADPPDTEDVHCR
jgi:hypothetical protein